MTDATLFTQAANAYQSAQVAPRIGQVDSVAQAGKVAREFESFFLGQVLQPMFANLGAEEPFGGGHAEKVWQGMLVQEYGKSMAEAGGIGIADAIQREILRAQEGRPQPQPQGQPQ